MRRARLLELPLLLLLIVATAPFAQAAEGEKINIFDPADIPLGIWSIVVFVILLLVLKKYAWGPILEGLQKREHTIQSAVQDAQQARDEAQRLRDQLQREVDKAHEKVRDILDEGRRHTQQATCPVITTIREQSERSMSRPGASPWQRVALRGGGVPRERGVCDWAELPLSIVEQTDEPFQHRNGRGNLVEVNLLDRIRRTVNDRRHSALHRGGRIAQEIDVLRREERQTCGLDAG